MSDDIKDAFTLAEEALEENTYDPFERAQGRGLPRTEITIYWDEASARDLWNVESDLQRITATISALRTGLQTADQAIKGIDESDADYKKKISDIRREKQNVQERLAETEALFEETEAKAAGIKEVVQQSGVTIGLKGFEGASEHDDIKDSLQKRFPPVDGAPNPQWLIHYNAAIIANSIEWTQAHGQERRTDKISEKTVLGWNHKLPEESWMRLVKATSEVTLATNFFKSLEDTGFLAKS